MDDATPIRGFRWWRFHPRGSLHSPYRGGYTWRRGANEAFCFDHRRFTRWRPRDVDHRRGVPEVACACGFYGVSAIEELDVGLARLNGVHISHSASSAMRLVLGIVAGHGRVLIGTQGWRAERAAVKALFVPPDANFRVALEKVRENYGVPLYSDLRALISEWGPEPLVLTGSGSV
jgi:hypothetical protein